MMPVYCKAVNPGKFDVSLGLTLDRAVDKLAKDGCAAAGRRIIERQLVRAGFVSGRIDMGKIDIEAVLEYIQGRRRSFSDDIVCRLEVACAI